MSLLGPTIFFVQIFFVVKVHVYTDQIGCFRILASRSLSIILCKCILVPENIMFGNDGRYLRLVEKATRGIGIKTSMMIVCEIKIH